MTLQFGRSLRPLWALAEGAAFLNHGSFGACPIEVLKEQDRIRADMESQPDQFFQKRIIPSDNKTIQTSLRAAAGELAAFVNASEGDVAFVENASAGIQAVLRSMPLSPGDRILMTDHTYNAVRLMVEAKCAATGATPIVVRLPVPTDAGDILERLKDAATPSVRLAIIDHFTSPTALVLPLERIIPEFHRIGARVLIDGAHALGQIPLDLATLRPDWYVSNAHKWLFAPKGCAFLYASPEMAALTQPNIVSHYVNMGFPRSFDYTGTRDNSAWLAAPAALAFLRRLDPAAVWSYQRRLMGLCSNLLSAHGAYPVSAASDMFAAMRSFVLPQRRTAEPADAPALQRALWDEDRIQTRVGAFGRKLLLRVSAQVYVDEDDMRLLSDALKRRGWPGQ